MLSWRRDKAKDIRLQRLEAVSAAIERSQAVIEFDLEGRILRANDNFLQAMGYEAEEVVGRKHAIFVSAEDAASPDYTAFWATLRRGAFVARKFRRIGKGGREVWIQASYNPVMGPDGRPEGVIKFATDITAQEQERDQSQRLAEAKAIQDEAVARVGAGLQALASGDLTFRIDGTMPEGFEQLQDDFNGAGDKLRDALVAIAESVAGLRAGSGEISQAADSLSQRTEQQAASLEETAAALDQINATLQRSAGAARDAREAVGAARADADLTGKVVGETVEAMDLIERSAKQISQIIGVIDEIAFQTNLLALNAGVEAARAGESGRGFAVVASEVRALAQRSAEAAKEIKALIGASSGHVALGVDRVRETGAALDRIVAHVGGIAGLVSDIAAGAQEQSLALSEVNAAVNQMDQMTQRNAAMVEESTAASRLLATDAERLARLVQRFRLGEGVSPGLSAAASTPPNVRPSSVPFPRRKAVGERFVPRVDETWDEF